MTLFSALKHLFKNEEIFRILQRNYTIARKYPVDNLGADLLPVYNYPARSEDCQSVHVWGKAEHGGLGIYLQKKAKMKNRKDKRFSKFNRPLRLAFAEQRHVTQVAAGYGFSLLVVKSQEGDVVFGTGINMDSQLGVHEPRRDAPLGLILSPVPILPVKYVKKVRVSSVGAGRAHTAIVTDNGSVLTLGHNAYGQCGRTIVEDENYSGSRVINTVSDLDGEKAIVVECGMDHTLLISESGKVHSCGWGADGQTGLGHYNSCGKFTRVLGDISEEKITKVSSRADCVLALNDKGDVFGWGNSEYSQLFKEEDGLQQVNRPMVLKKCRGFGKIVDVAAGGSHCLMLNENGDVFSWGYGVLGQGPNAEHSWLPRLIPSTLFGRNEFQPDSRVISVKAGISFSAAITNKGDVYTWGKNNSSCLGLGDDKDQFFPLRVALGLSAVRISLGVDHAVCITKT